MALLNTTCPLCDAPHAKKLSVIYSEGLSNVNTSIQSVGTLNTIGRQKITTNGTVAGIQQTDASKKAARPIVPSFTSNGANKLERLVIGGAILAVVYMIIVGNYGGGAMAFFGGLIVLIMIISSMASNIDVKPTQEEIDLYEEKNKIQLDAYRKWEHTFACNSCGHRFIPDESPV